MLSSGSTSTKISAEGAYILWRTVVETNVNNQQLHVLKNFVHDKDFYNYIEKLTKELQSEIKLLNKMLDKFDIIGPNPGPPDVNLKAFTEAFTDHGIAGVIYRLLRLDLVLILINNKHVPIDDEVENTLIDLIKSSIKRVDYFIMFAKRKNWLFMPPIFTNTPKNVKEEVSTNEIHLLWDHLNFRYNNIRTTQLYATYAQDKDFVLILNIGLKTLKNQAKILEEKLSYYGVPLPRPYPDTLPQTKINKEYFEDRYLFNNILRGIQDAVALHGSAIQEVILNNGLRKFFIDLALDEISYMTKLGQYGKLKGWSAMPPLYKS